jgi:EAL domain-containing protein (putative c-di-GMP-specific phosphodiesterase class I)
VDDEVRVSVNVSGRQLDDGALPAHVRDAIAAAGLPADSLRLEVTESTLAHEPRRIHDVISRICATGVGLHLDDFGTGYSSLAALHNFPVDTLKIDRSFVAAMNGRPDESDAIVRSTIALAHSLRLRVIAEGIEDLSQLRRLRALGCEYGQGFLFSEPLTEEDTEALLATWSPAGATALEDQAAVR